MHQAYQDTLTTSTFVDQYRAHDNHVLHWLIQAHKYKLLITDMGKPAPGSVFNQTSLPPGERMVFDQAEIWHKAIWTGAKTLLDLFRETGCNQVVMLFPERSQHHLMYLSILQRNMAILYTAQKHGVLPDDWQFGILFNVHRFPLDDHGEPLVQIGMNLAHGTEVLHQSLWGFIHQISILTPPKMGQFGIGWWTRTPMTRASYYAVAKFTGENPEALELMDALLKAHPVQYTYVHTCMHAYIHII